MATLFAQSTGTYGAINWNTQPGGGGTNVTPVAGDTLYCNSFTITVSSNLNLGSSPLRNTNGDGATVGGKFQTTGAVTFTFGTATAGSTGVECVRVNVTGIVNGNGLGGSVNGAHGIYAVNGAIVNGNGTGGSVDGAHGIYATHGSKVRCYSATQGTGGATAYGVYAVNGCDVRIYSGTSYYLDSTCRTVEASLDWLLQDGLIGEGDSGIAEYLGDESDIAAAIWSWGNRTLT